MTTVLIVNGQALQRLGLRLLLEAQPDLTVVGEATDRGQAVRAADALQPDVVLMDMSRTDVDRMEAIRRIARPDSRSGAPAAGRASGVPRGCWC
jgi:DNA-binding NarL/FixJ family response regulator